MLQEIHRMLTVRGFNTLVNISLKDKYVYFKTPKVASSTLGKTLSAYESRNLPGAKTPPHPHIEESVFVKPYQLPDPMLKNILWGKGFFRFTMVRNPYERLVSAYKDKIINSAPEKVQILNVLGRMGLIERDEGDLERDVSFEQFISAVTHMNHAQLNNHWKPQALLTCARWLKHDFVGRLDNFAADIETLQELSGIPVKDELITHVPHRTDAQSTWRDLYTETLADRVATQFAEDFKCFGYDMASWRPAGGKGAK
ncbi:MAG: sulfotransferase family protein [Alphaproteobacteria bacterium]|nr:MAG: sulfotransferase family protein [Alphaproteobacteria bacterium]